jgi:hypothetical protein
MEIALGLDWAAGGMAGVATEAVPAPANIGPDPKPLGLRAYLPRQIAIRHQVRHWPNIFVQTTPGDQETNDCLAATRVHLEH